MVTKLTDLPLELLSLVLDELEPANWKILNFTCQKFRSLVIPRIWHSLEIRSKFDPTEAELKPLPEMAVKYDDDPGTFRMVADTSNYSAVISSIVSVAGSYVRHLVLRGICPQMLVTFRKSAMPYLDHLGQISLEADCQNIVNHKEQVDEILKSQALSHITFDLIVYHPGSLKILQTLYSIRKLQKLRIRFQGDEPVDLKYVSVILRACPNLVQLSLFGRLKNSDGGSWINESISTLELNDYFELAPTVFSEQRQKNNMINIKHLTVYNVQNSYLFQEAEFPNVESLHLYNSFKSRWKFMSPIDIGHSFRNNKSLMELKCISMDILSGYGPLFMMETSKLRVLTLRSVQGDRDPEPMVTRKDIDRFTQKCPNLKILVLDRTKKESEKNTLENIRIVLTNCPELQKFYLESGRSKVGGVFCRMLECGSFIKVTDKIYEINLSTIGDVLG